MAHVALQMRRAGREVVERHLKERRRLREICEWLGTWGVGEAGKTVVVGCMAGKGGGADREIDHTEMLQSVKTAFKQFFFLYLCSVDLIINMHVLHAISQVRY